MIWQGAVVAVGLQAFHQPVQSDTSLRTINSDPIRPAVISVNVAFQTEKMVCFVYQAKCKPNLPCKLLMW